MDLLYQQHSPILLQKATALPTSPSIAESRHRQRTSSLFSTLQDHRSNIQKATHNVERHRSISISQPQRLRQLAQEQADRQLQLAVSSVFSNPTSASSTADWWTPQSSPQTRAVSGDTLLAIQLQNWAIPSPPGSDSGIPSGSLDAAETSLSTFNARSELLFEQPVPPAEMSSLGLLLPSQYGSNLYESDINQITMDPNYIPPMRMSHPHTTQSMPVYTQSSTSTNPELYHSRTYMPESTDARRTHDANMAAADYSHRRISMPFDPGMNQGYPAVSGPAASAAGSFPHAPMGASQAGSHYTSQVTRSPTIYDSAVFHHPNYHAPQASAPHPYVGPGHQAPQLSYATFGSSNEIDGKMHGSGHEPSMRVLNQRPKPQCWDHGCNGRQFSTFSNLLRHQREKSGTAAKSYCPKCGAEFTRTTARNGHLAHDKCTKQRRPSDGGKS